MRLNKYIAQATGMSRRGADDAIKAHRVRINNRLVQLGELVRPGDTVTLDGSMVTIPEAHTTIALHKPRGYVCSRQGQGSKTIYDLLPASLHSLKSVGRLDKESSGLLIMTTDGALAQRLTHPGFEKRKVYIVVLDRPLTSIDQESITENGIDIGDNRASRFRVEPLENRTYRVILEEGRNRQIRRTFQAMGYKVIQLHRTQFGDFVLGTLQPGKYSLLN